MTQRRLMMLLAFVFPLAPRLARAQQASSSDIQSLSRQVNDLNKRLLELETRLSPPPAASSWASDLPVKFGGFIDTYYAYDFDQPPNFDRAYTAQAARANEFNVNLAYMDAVVNSDRVHGRFALQTGNSVQATYAGEPTVGKVSGPSVSQFIQEAWAGYRVTDKLWINGGIYFSHIGMESFISKDNWTYTRSMMGEFSPTYQSGVWAAYQFNDDWSGQLHLINGWQNISENNQNKALGTQISYAPEGGWSATYNTFWGQKVGNQGRFLNDFIFKTPAWGKWQFEASADYGIQHKPAGKGDFSSWYGGSLIGRYQLTQRVAMAARVERFADPDQVVVQTGAGAFKTNAASVNVDVQLQKQLVWRNELREYWAENAVFPAVHGLTRTDGYIATSLGLTF